MTVIDTFGSNSRQVVADGVGGSYASANGAASGNNTYNISTATDHNILHNSKSGSVWFIRRADFQFDTSTIPSGSTIVSATLTFNVDTSGSLNTDSETVVLLDNTNNSNLSSPLANEDYNDFTTTSIGSETLATLIASSGNKTMSITDNSVIATGAGAVTRIGMRFLGDINVTEPTSWNILRIQNAVDMPYLDVTWTTGSAQNSAFFQVL